MSQRNARRQIHRQARAAFHQQPVGRKQRRNRQRPYLHRQQFRLPIGAPGLLGLLLL